MIDVLIVKTSSLGDVVHALPVLSDIQRVYPDWKIAWMVEESLQALPKLHPFCAEVIPVATRRWRKSWLGEATKQELKQLRSRLKEIQPHYVLDLQGLIKSALLARLSPGLHLGYRWGSARENLATLLYDQGFAVSWNQHAVERNRKLAAASLGYGIHETPCDYGVFQNSAHTPSKDAILIHSSSWQTKLWPEESWIALGQVLSKKGLRCVLPSGSPSEWERAQRLVQQIPYAIALPPGPLADCIGHLAGAHSVVGVDTGLTHLATALNLPTVALYRVTDPAATGVFGSDRAINLGGKSGCPSVDAVLITLTRLGCFSAVESA